jgi:hypothetical protein
VTSRAAVCAARVVASVAVAGATRAAVRRATGLGTGCLVGAADNTDGQRLFCGVGLRPATADGRADWKGGVVVEFVRTSTPVGTEPIPSAALLLLRAAACGGRDEHWSLGRLGSLYTGLATGVAFTAAWAGSAAAPTGVLAVVPALLPLADRNFSRFFISTYSEPAGLLGTVSFVSGTAVLAVTRPEDVLVRVVGLLLTGGGGLLAATAKNALTPVLLVAAGQCAYRNGRLGASVALGTLAAAAWPVLAAHRWQTRHCGAVNSHNLVFTLLLPEAGPDAATAVGLPLAATAFSGRGASDANGRPIDPDLIPGWQEAIGTRPHRAMRDAWAQLARRPRVLTRVVGNGLRATLGRSVDYLPSHALPPGVAQPRTVVATPSMGHDVDALRGWLADLPAPWRPAAIVTLSLAAPVAVRILGGKLDGVLSSGRGGVLGGRADRTLCGGGFGEPAGLATAAARVAAVSAIGALGLVALAVLGDGYYEITKHVWPAAYLLDVATGALGMAAADAVAAAISRRCGHG